MQRVSPGTHWIAAKRPMTPTAETGRCFHLRSEAELCATQDAEEPRHALHTIHDDKMAGLCIMKTASGQFDRRCSEGS